jgi:hypothetical protein
MPKIIHILIHAIYLIILASANFTVGEWVDVDYSGRHGFKGVA